MKGEPPAGESPLAAILCADAAAFSVFAGRGEAAAVRALKGHIGAIEPVIGLHSGRVVKGAGDGFLAEFGSVVEAVSCADAIQTMMAARHHRLTHSPKQARRRGAPRER
ncbi:hypothetical protein G5B40_05460 [Pikeienuella piscinae]|uniref:Adenylate/guanylate cyclase domain-containing protein n=1 Tax=Pikeienuella piscinae TaxID=2748098 RepID=A0A7L5BXH0_9RHOB|nr:hypothetical protein [Pikeienuella piscinae]QIE54946.1 hypothetical protein G5B40_05460 [Pikeienuella piscinae]